MTVEEVKRLREQGYTFAAIGKYYGISRQAVWEFCKKNKVKVVPRFKRFCQTCAKPFITTVHNKVFCCHECAMKKPKTFKMCFECNKLMITRKENQIYCSAKCRRRNEQKWYRWVKKERAKDERKRGNKRGKIGDG